MGCYRRRQHNLEEEYAELEYQIRCLMLCPESNKTDSDKTREEQLIQRSVQSTMKLYCIVSFDIGMLFKLLLYVGLDLFYWPVK